MHRPRKRLGQHFLHAPTVIDRILHSIAAQPGQHLLEIGPGQGAITRPLLETGAILDVVELDRDLVPELESLAHLFAGRMRVYHRDALEFDVCSCVTPGERLRVVGNLPYNISTPLLFHLMDSLACIADMHFMLQKEVVDRMAAAPGSKAYGRLSVMLQYHCQVQPLFGIGPGAFNPPPRVDSAFVRLTPHPHPPVTVDDPAMFANVVRQAFMYRRKTLRNALKTLVDSEGFSAADVDPDLRAERLGLEEFARLAAQARPLKS